ncbi:MAG: DUF2845 domain-containing protein [Thermodesulfobacteriota bacterium]|jgi:hypothetical protein|nr:MAG: DUF2845 domain-containing protein [Thermodesulfobacteriota bacterium]
MKKTYVLLSIFLLLSMVHYAKATDACRCGNKLASTGDTKAEVLAKCGPPAFSEERTEERIERSRGDDYYDERGNLNQPLYNKVQVNVDEWFYNFGPNQFMQIFKFENGRLISIENGDYGY